MADQIRATYTIDEVARILGVGRNLVYRSAESGELSKVAIRIGRRVLVPKEALHRILAPNTDVLAVPASNRESDRVPA